MQRWPWIAGLISAAAALNPIGQDFIIAAFFSGEQLSRNIAQPLVFIAALALVVLGLVEWWIRMMLRKRTAAKTVSPRD